MLFHETNKQFISCRLEMNLFSFCLPYFTNDLSKQFHSKKKLLNLFKDEQMRGKSNFRAGCIEQNHFGYM